MISKDVGLVDKYHVVRQDGKVKDNANYFVLDLNNDPGAVPAIVSYMGWAEENGYVELAADLESLLEDLGKI